MKEENNIDSNYIVQYILKSMQQQNIEVKEQQSNLDIKNPMFLYEFFVFELYIPKPVLHSINTPVLAFRLLDFPTQTIEGVKNKEKSSISFNQGKSCFFEMEINRLKTYLIEEPLYIMLMDTNNGNMRVLGSSRVNISVFNYDQFLDYKGDSPLPRRNILKLFDNSGNTVGEFDMTLLIKKEIFKYQDKPKTNNDIPSYLRNKCEEMDPMKNINKNENVDKIFNLLKNEEDYINFIKTQKGKKASDKENDSKSNIKNIKYEEEDYEVKKANTTKAKKNKVDIELDQINAKSIQNFLDPSNKETYIGNLKALLDGKENSKLPPPMFFAKERKTDEFEARKLYKQMVKKEPEKEHQEELDSVYEDNEENKSQSNKSQLNKSLSNKDKSTIKDKDNDNKDKNKDTSTVNSKKDTKDTKVVKHKEKDKFVTKPKEVKQDIKIADPEEQRNKVSKMKQIFTKNTVDTNPNQRYYENKMREINRYNEHPNQNEKLYDKYDKYANDILEDENEYINIYNRMKPTEKKKIYEGKKKTSSGTKIQEINKNQGSNKGNLGNPMVISKDSNYADDQFLSISHSQYFSISNSNNQGNNLVLSKESKDQNVTNNGKAAEKANQNKIPVIKSVSSKISSEKEDSIKSSLDNTYYKNYLKSSKDNEGSDNKIVEEIEKTTPLNHLKTNKSHHSHKSHMNDNDKSVKIKDAIKEDSNQSIHDTISEDYKFDDYEDIVEEDIPNHSPNKKTEAKPMGNSTLVGNILNINKQIT